ncbi:MAG: CUB domain-containing protein [Saprospiraceae bacterium]|nr:CUB domain-containing protein [Saprospiraceae bacterium]
MNSIQKQIVSLILMLFVILKLSGQNYNMNNTSVTTTTGNFYDSGGSGSNYGNNQNFTKTFCTGNANSIAFNFSSFSLQSSSGCGSDRLVIYDGPNTSSPLIGTYCGTTSPGYVVSSGTCMTFVFISNGSTNSSGWAASISQYVTDCQGSMQVVPSNPTSCTGTNGYLEFVNYNDTRYEASINGTNWVAPGNNITGLGVGNYTVTIRDKNSRRTCRTLPITLTYTDNTLYSSITVTNATGCNNANGSIRINGISGASKVSWISAINRNYVNASTLSGANTINGLLPGEYYLKVTTSGSTFCVKEEKVIVGNSGAACPVPTLCINPVGENRFPNGDFGSGSAQTGPALPVSETSYGFVNITCQGPDDGLYSIVNQTDCDPSTAGGQQVFSTWDILTEDHTEGDVGGYMMLVNAAFAPDIAFEKTIPNLCPNTRYQFSFYIRNIYPAGPIKPNLTFLVDGIGQYSTGDVTAGGWQNVGFTFNTGNNTTATFSVRNNNTGGDGNDWLIDDIFVGICEPSVVVTPGKVCIGDENAVLNAVITDDLKQYSWYKWQFSTNGGSSWTDLTSSVQGTYPSNGNSFSTTYNMPNPIPSTYSNRIYRIVVATSSGNLTDSNCNAVSGNVVTIGNTSISSQPGPIIECQGDNQSLSAVVSGNTSGNVYQWQASNNGTTGWADASGPGNATLNYTPPSSTIGVKYYRLFVNNPTNGCTNVYSNVVAVNVQAPPTASITGDLTICVGSSTTLTASGGSQFLWSNGSTNASITVSPISNTTYSVTVSNPSCSSTSMATKLVEVNSVSGGVLGNNQTVCNGGDPVIISE